MHSSRPHLCSPWCPVESEQVRYDRQPVLGHAQAHRALPTGEVNSSPAVNCLIHCSSASDLERPLLRGCSLLDPSPQPQPCQAELHQDPAGMHRESHMFRRGLGTPLPVQRNLGKVLATSAASEVSGSGALGCSGGSSLLLIQPWGRASGSGALWP